MASSPDIEAQNREPQQLDTEHKDIEPFITSPPPEGPGSHARNSTIGPHEGQSGDGDFDDRAAQFWAVYVKEARGHDEALIGTWKDDMEGVIIFAGLYSAALTAFIVESVKKLRLDPLDQNTYYTRQSVALLAQISAQLAASGSPVPSTVALPPAYPEFRAAHSDVRVNIYWFMSLVFSLSAALAATLVQQWVREYVQVFQRYSHPLKCARIRQFLYDGSKRWHMDVVVNIVPALIHISLFLFFLGLADFLFATNTATATTTTTAIIICTLCYLFTIVAPVWYAQSPYQSPLSGVFWHLFFRTVSTRTFKDHRTGDPQRISTNMTEGRVQLAMDWSDDRKDRDAHAIKWVVDDLTEDSELEPLIRNIPDSFNSDWGKKVWEVVAKDHERENSGAISRLDGRIARLLKTCTDPAAFQVKAEREQRARACIGASSSLVLSVDYEWTWLAQSEIQTMAQVLIYLSDDVRRLRDVPTGVLDPTSSIRWTCMSIIVVRKTLQALEVRSAAEDVINCLAEVRGERYGSNADKAAKTAVTIDEYLKTCWNSADSLHHELIRDADSDTAEERLRKIVRTNKREIATLDDTWNAFGWAEETDKAIAKLTQTLREATGSVLLYLPGTVLTWGQESRHVPEDVTQPTLTYFMPQFIPPRLLVQRLWLCAWALRNIFTGGWGTSVYTPKKLADLSAPELSVPTMRKLMDETEAPMETQLWRLQDLRAGGLFYTLELFIATIKSSHKAASRDLSRELYEGTFRVITRKWEEYQHSIWTEMLLVDLLERALPNDNDPSSDQVPDHIVGLFLTFLSDVLAKKTGPHVQHAISLIKAYCEGLGDSGGVARDVLSKLKSPATQSVNTKF